MPKKCSRSSSARSDRKTDSVISSDSDIRFTRRKLGEQQRCGCAVFAGFLIFTLFATVTGYIGCKLNLNINYINRSSSGRLLNQFFVSLKLNEFILKSFKRITNT